MTRSRKTIKILYLYPYEMNTYGDWGNVQVLRMRLQWRGWEAKVIEHRPGNALPTDPDIIFFGGGQDSGQSLIIHDLQTNSDQLRTWIEMGKPMLAICGGYQLLGREFVTQAGDSMPGLGVLDLRTVARSDRFIGNVVLESPIFGTVVGFENHSGRTFLGPGLTPLGTVTQGSGNNGEDKGEGVIYKSTLGTYLHGPLLPKNPQVADWLIERALPEMNKNLIQLPDTFVAQARAIAVRRPR